MIVRCANCHTEFSLDEHQIGPDGATVRCSVCSYVFPVDPPPGAGEHPWQIRTVEDLLFTAPDLATLRTWIAEGRLHPDDEVSRTGKHWIRLGDMPEFSTAFTGFSDLPPVFVELEPPSPAGSGSALEQLGPPPGFGQTMPVIQGVDTDILVVRPESISDFEVPVTARSIAVERSAPGDDGGPVPEPVSPLGDASAPMPFPLTSLPLDDSEPLERSDPDESVMRMRPRAPRTGPHTPTREVSAIPDVVEDLPAKGARRRPANPTIRYGTDEVHGASSMLDAVTTVVDEDDPPTRESAEVRSTAAAVERVSGRHAVVPYEDEDEDADADQDAPRRHEVRPHVVRRSGRARAAVREDDELRSPRAQGAGESEDSERSGAKPRRRHRTFAREIDAKPRRRAWPLVAALGLLGGVAVVFGVPSIRAKVMGLAGNLAGGERFELSSLEELAQARAAVASVDPIALGEAEAALQGRLDEGKVPPRGIAQMKLAQVELLTTRSLDQALSAALQPSASPAVSPSDDVERATRILAGVVAEDVVDRADMRRVRARLRLAQGRPPAEILPLLPKDGSGELRQLVMAASLWRDPSAPIPNGVIGGLQGLPERSVLTDLVLGVAYLRAGDRAKAGALARAVLGRVPEQPTALALQARVEGTAAPDPAGVSVSVASGSGGGGTAEAGSGTETADGSSGQTAGSGDTEGSTEPAPSTGGDAPAKERGSSSGTSKPAVKLESVDSLIDRGCTEVENGNISAGLDLLRKAKSRRPGDLDLLLCTGQGYAKQGNTQRALRAYEAALRRSPSFASALREAARAADKLGDKDKALRYYRRLLSQRPGDSAARAYVEKNG
ncbi:MAG: zinc-ribbon domain-containing protein [Myxococcota bacterium]